MVMMVITVTGIRHGLAGGGTMFVVEADGHFERGGQKEAAQLKAQQRRYDRCRSARMNQSFIPSFHNYCPALLSYRTTHGPGTLAEYPYMIAHNGLSSGRLAHSSEEH